ncbi:unnamed protein product [Orchesella dallaii]|uniref:Uncharacterized protein n=1 Tax=Orchesella dallaii TaxID=48710 RepID=A0ABP1QPC5_9HEXA
MPCRIYLRHQQTWCQRHSHSSQDTKVVAPLWAKEGLKVLGEHLKGITFEVFDNESYPKRHNTPSSNVPVESFTISEDFNGQSLKILQQIARNESHNTTGVINTSLYSDIKDRRVLYSIRDLVRQCVVVGVDEAKKCGGYNCVKEKQTKQRVYVCDLAALQFQQPYNTGRFVLIEENPHKGILDDLIYENVVGERKKQFEEVKKSWESNDTEARNRYIRHDGYGLPGRSSCFIDSKAYQKFVALDVLISGLALSELASLHGDKLNFKFLKYGTGFFAWKFSSELDKLILKGVMDGLEHLFMRNDPKVLNTIKHVELPFYKIDPNSLKRIKDFKTRYGVDIIASTNDALKQTRTSGTKRLITATTNCGDNHAACGNEMGYSSVDAAIAENLVSKGNIFSANINTMMSEGYIEI